ncbi:MAG: hypothetical protein SF029_15020 [bacterium]|nr:hypothetical protein [bacterium]
MKFDTNPRRPNTATGNRPRLDGRTIGIGVLLLLAAVLILPRLFDRSSAGQEEDTLPQVEQDRSSDSGSSSSGGGSASGGSSNSGTFDEDVFLGNPVAAPAVDRDGCPVETTDDFDATEDVWVVAPDSQIPEGTIIFVRLYRNGTPIEDAPEIQADQDYDSTCINFIFEATDGGFEAGEYEAEFYVNGNPADTVTFDIR